MRWTVMRFLARLRYRVWDVWDWLRGRRDPLIPPRALAFNFMPGASPHFQKAYKKVGVRYRQLFVELANLQPHDHVLEVGSGIGRIALALTDYLDNAGRYEGIDINKMGVEWCQQHIASRYPNFRFRHIDIYNRHYNPGGRPFTEDDHFPFPDETFDFVFLASVFTHMLPHDIDLYLGEIERVLKPGGTSLMTFFVLDETAENRIRQGRATFSFQYHFDGYRAEWRDIVERAVAFREEDVRDMLTKNRLSLVEPIHYGTWSGRDDGLSLQDVIVVTKPSPQK